MKVVAETLLLVYRCLFLVVTLSIFVILECTPSLTFSLCDQLVIVFNTSFISAACLVLIPIVLCEKLTGVVIIPTTNGTGFDRGNNEGLYKTASMWFMVSACLWWMVTILYYVVIWFWGGSKKYKRD